jgi:phage gpG-like protein
MSFKTTRKDRGADAIRKVVEDLKNKTQPYVAVGVIGNKAEEPRGQINNATLAAIHEFGTEDGHIPARSFLRSTFREKRSAMLSLTKDLYSKVIFRKLSVEEALAIIGEKFVSEIKAKITAGIPPPNAESTIKQKGSSTPLIDTGQLINSITYKVEEHGNKE